MGPWNAGGKGQGQGQRGLLLRELLKDLWAMSAGQKGRGHPVQGLSLRMPLTGLRATGCQGHGLLEWTVAWWWGQRAWGNCMGSAGQQVQG